MAGKIKAAIDQIIAQQSHGNANMIASLKIKLIRRGIDPDRWHETSPDDPAMCLRVENAAKEMDVTLPDAIGRASLHENRPAKRRSSTPDDD